MGDLDVRRNVVVWGVRLLGYCPEPSVKMGNQSSVGGEEGAEDAVALESGCGPVRYEWRAGGGQVP